MTEADMKEILIRLEDAESEVGRLQDGVGENADKLSEGLKAAGELLVFVIKVIHQNKDKLEFLRKIVVGRTRVKVKYKTVRPAVSVPSRQTPGSAGYDLRSSEDAKIYPGVTTIVKTGIAVEIPEGYEMQIRPRSGLSFRGLTVQNAPGTIDSDYRGEIGVILRYLGPDAFYMVKKGDRIAQCVVAPVVSCDFELVEELGNSERGDGGFGSTGD